MNQQGNFEEDISPTSPGSDNTLLALKRARKQIEADAQLLANRIALLKQEELKSWKKIEETKKKAREIYILKKKNEEKMQQKQMKELQSQSNNKDAQNSTIEARRTKEKQKEDMLMAIYNQKHEGAVSLKKQSQKNDMKKDQFKEKVVQSNQYKSQKVKEQEALTILKKQEAEANKLVQNRLNYERRMAEEETLKRKKEAEVLNMEKLEMELIKKLQHTQTLQKTAYEELEQALAQSPGDYAKKYAKNDNFSSAMGQESPFRKSISDKDKQTTGEGEGNEEEQS